MYINGDLISNSILSKTHVFGLLQSAVVSIPVVVPIKSYKLLKPGRIVKFNTEDPKVVTLECMILDIESIKKPEGDAFTVRITIQSSKIS
jgi:hypothetical protein